MNEITFLFTVGSLQLFSSTRQLMPDFMIDYLTTIGPLFELGRATN